MTIIKLFDSQTTSETLNQSSGVELGWCGPKFCRRLFVWIKLHRRHKPQAWISPWWGNSSCFPPHQQLVNGENRPLVIDELVEFEIMKQSVEVQDFRILTDHCKKNPYRISLKLMMENRKMSTCWTWKHQDLDQLCSNLNTANNTLAYSPPTLKDANHQWTAGNNTNCNQWLSLAKSTLKMALTDRNCS
jgi:hypothetical protein